VTSDERGFFARTYSSTEFAAHGLSVCATHCNQSFNHRAGTLRGMHYQASPHEEAKLVSCVRGAIYDVVLDIRRRSETFGTWAAVELSDESSMAIYVPEGCAHGFQTLQDRSMVSYQMSTSYHGDSARGVRADDPTFGIRWPLPVTVMSSRDRAFALWKE
jgi:dTDP-4-dehydrorhamnose 3,5-epimerase